MGVVALDWCCNSIKRGGVDRM
ncbi:protein of unknown function [Moritella yayanosii]|uniref:Uncharacterized protein n=1 Tax=Moritella yayanosii TaxID=69539 RepID=A0A330LM20_9GAMM|nr:protein of unknown function [Moritella yayanosii]